jgi:hypothetical protein
MGRTTRGRTSDTLDRIMSVERAWVERRDESFYLAGSRVPLATQWMATWPLVRERKDAFSETHTAPAELKEKLHRARRRRR